MFGHFELTLLSARLQHTCILKRDESIQANKGWLVDVSLRSKAPRLLPDGSTPKSSLSWDKSNPRDTKLGKNAGRFCVSDQLTPFIVYYEFKHTE